MSLLLNRLPGEFKATGPRSAKGPPCHIIRTCHSDYILGRQGGVKGPVRWRNSKWPMLPIGQESSFPLGDFHERYFISENNNLPGKLRNTKSGRLSLSSVRPETCQALTRSRWAGGTPALPLVDQRLLSGSVQSRLGSMLVSIYLHPDQFSLLRLQPYCLHHRLAGAPSPKPKL